jgi:cell division protein FtsB
MVAKLSKFGKKKSTLFENTVAIVVFTGILSIIIGFFIFQNVKIAGKRADLEDHLQELQAQANALSEQKAGLQEDIANTQTQEYQEKVLREQGLYKKPGEDVITVLPPEITIEEISSEEQKQRTWWNPFTW